MILDFNSTVCPLHGTASSETGGRKENQDAFGYADTPLGSLVVVCDGMGGGPGGRTASHTAVDEVIKTVSQYDSTMDRHDALKTAVGVAQERLAEAMTLYPQLQGMGTTVVAVLFSRQSAVIVHAGDSRCYRFSHKRQAFRTTDHSLVAELMRHGVLTEEEARRSPQSNVITRGLGSMENHVPEIDEVPYRRGDRFVLCSDGVWGVMHNDSLAAKITALASTRDTVEQLTAEVDRIGFAAGGSHDNHTLVVVDMEADSIMKDKMDKNIRNVLLALAAALVVSVVMNIALTFGYRNAKSSLERDAEELRQKMEEICGEASDLKAYENRYKESRNVLDEMLKDIAVMKHSNDSLKTEIDTLSKKNEALQKDLKKANERVKALESKEKKNTPQPKPAQGKGKTQTKKKSGKTTTYKLG